VPIVEARSPRPARRPEGRPRGVHGRPTSIRCSARSWAARSRPGGSRRTPRRRWVPRRPRTGPRTPSGKSSTLLDAIADRYRSFVPVAADRWTGATCCATSPASRRRSRRRVTW